MNNTLDTFIKFLADDYAADMYITGIAGTGKTTSLYELLDYCHKQDISVITTAYTHKACSVLRSKLPAGTEVRTLHSFLSKRPTVNDKATNINHVHGNTKAGESDEVRVLFIDEFSMIGEKDFVDISDLQYDIEGEVKTKVVYIGDPNQLPPVKDAKAIEPHGKYWVNLTKVYRQAGDNPLIDTLLELNDYLNGAEPQPLVEHETFTRKNNIVDLYKRDNKDKIILAYTNAQVQALNAEIQGRDEPILGDEVFSPTVRQHYLVADIDDNTDYIMTIGDKMLELNTKYKTLETLHGIDGVKFYTLVGTKDEEIRAAVFGHARYLEVQQELANKAVFINKQIEMEFNMDAKLWAENNRDHPTARARGKAWSKFMSFKTCVICLDFNHAMTVHKSQGSTYENVYVDIEDLGRCADKDYIMYLKLLYVAISRASGRVFTN